MAKDEFRIFKEKPEVISEGPIWVCISEGYIYTAETLPELITMLNTEWKHDKHLGGY